MFPQWMMDHVVLTRLRAADYAQRHHAAGNERQARFPASPTSSSLRDQHVGVARTTFREVRPLDTAGGCSR